MTTFCTYFDSKYADRGLLLWRSLRDVLPGARLFVCCLDDSVHALLRKMKADDLIPLRLAELEAHYPDLAAVKETRSRIEYYFTLTPWLVSYVVDVESGADIVTYVDSDLFFYRSPEPLLSEIREPESHVAIIEHRFPDDRMHLKEYGIFNVGWVSFKRSPEGLRCLRDWQQKCLEWCYDHVDGERFADQKYLDAWPSKFAGVVILRHRGANVALWNLVPGTTKRTKTGLFVHDEPLIFYHFHALSQISKRAFSTGVHGYDTWLDRVVRREVYGPYMHRLRQIQSELRKDRVEPLLRCKYSVDDLAYAARHRSHGLFLYSMGRSALSIADPLRPFFSWWPKAA